jgi:hypothetical protein
VSSPVAPAASTNTSRAGTRLAHDRVSRTTKTAATTINRTVMLLPATNLVLLNSSAPSRSVVPIFEPVSHNSFNTR